MARIAGVKVVRNTKGVAKKLVIDIDKHYSYLEDFLDMLDIELRKDEDTITFDEAVKDLKKKKKIKSGTKK